MNQLAPEQIELNKKLAVLDRLKDRLADREEEMTELRAAQEQFEARVYDGRRPAVCRS